MQEPSRSQLELFSGAASQVGTSAGKSAAFIGYLRLYERTLLIIIGFIITALAAYSFGIEQGKRIAMPIVQTAAPLLPQRAAVPQAAPLKQPVTAAPVQAPKPASTPVKPDILQGGYAIQLASYQGLQQAQKEAAALKKKGLQAYVLKKGKYSVLYVGTYTTKTTAQSMLSQLKKRYHDCIIRRL